MSDVREATLRRQDHATPEMQEKDSGRARFLAKEEFSRKSLSYMATCVVAIFLGLIVLPVFLSAVIPLSEDVRSGGFRVDLFFLLIIPLLSINLVSYNYMFVHRDPFRNWLLFQRSLPISPKEIVLARSLVMLPATVVLTTLFFTPLIMLSMTIYSRFDAEQYLWFILIWLGYALFFGGLNLYMELGLNGKLVFALQPIGLILLISVAWLMNGDLVFTTFEWAGAYGPLPAGISLLGGGLLFALLAKATERRVGKREMSE